MISTREAIELRHYFEIKSDLAAAEKTAPWMIDLYLNELAVMAMHTASRRIARACRSTIAGFQKPASAIRA